MRYLDPSGGAEWPSSFFVDVFSCTAFRLSSTDWVWGFEGCADLAWNSSIVALPQRRTLDNVENPWVVFSHELWKIPYEANP